MTIASLKLLLSILRNEHETPLVRKLGDKWVRRRGRLQAGRQVSLLCQIEVILGSIDIALSSFFDDNDAKYTERMDMRKSSQPLNICHSATSFPNHVPVTRQYAMILTS